MAASINDKFTEATNGSRPVPTTLTALLPSGASPGTATCGALTGWPTATAVHFIIYTVDVNGRKVSGSQTDWKGVVSGSTITGLVLKAGTNNGYAIGAVVEAAPTAAWADDVTEGIAVEHNQDGTHKSTATVGGRIITNFAPPGMVVPYAGSSAPTDWLLCDGSAVSRTTYASLFAITSTTFGAGDGSTTFNLPDLRTRAPIGAGAGTFVTTFASATDVNTGTDVITVPSNVALITGTAVILTTSNTLPTGLSLATTYYVIRVSATTIKLATSLANAVAGTQIDITGTGTGTQTITVTYTNYALGVKGGEETHAQTQAEMAAHTHTWNSGQATATGGGTTGVALNNAGFNIAGPSSTTGSGTAFNVMQPFLSLNYIIKT